MKYNRFLPLLSAILVFLFTEAFYTWPHMLYVFLVLPLLWFLFTVRQYVHIGEKNGKWWNFMIFPSLFYICVIAFALLTANGPVLQLMALANMVLIYLYFRTLYQFQSQSDKYKVNSIENISAYGNFLTVFLMGSAIYGLQSALNMQVWLLALIFVFAAWLVIYQVMWANGIELRSAFFFILLLCLVLLEIAWTLSFLPLNYYVLGLVLAICYYMAIGILRFYLIDKLDKITVKLYLIFGFLCIAIVMLTSRWM